MKTSARAIRHQRIRATITGTAERPRVAVFHGAKTLSAQLVDDAAHKTLLTVRQPASNLAAATKLGSELAKQAKAKKISTVVFDRAGYAYHGVVKAIADALRDGGVKV